MLRPVRAAAPCLFLLGCGFTTPGGGIGPGDASHVSDSPLASGDSNLAGDAPTIDAMADATAASCPTSFVTVPNAGTSSKYLVFPKTSQLGALTGCPSGTHLLHLDDQAEADALEAYITANSSSPTGLYRVVGARDGFFRDLWHDLDFITLLTFLPWGQNEPTDVFLAGEDCIVLKSEQSTAVIGAQECSSAHEFACECD
jgi:hypothetical protein